ncbi:MAG TPA: glycogen/starch/alpha-glucan phosphorylase, partial [Polyangiaceae bacterium]
MPTSQSEPTPAGPARENAELNAFESSPLAAIASAQGVTAVAPRAISDSKPPLPSALSVLPTQIGDAKAQAQTARPRVSFRPSNFLSGYDLPMDQESLRVGIAGHIEYTQGKDEFSVTPLDYFAAAARSTRDRMFDRWNKTQQEFYRTDQRRVYVLSLEYLLGRLFEDALLNLGIHESMSQALSELGVDIADLMQCEPDAGLGNGGLGRLAACMLDSMATLGVAA